MNISFIMFIIFNTHVITLQNTLKSKTEKNYEISYEEAIKKANEYAIKKDVEKSLFYAKKAYEQKKSKESLYALLRIYNYKKDYKQLKNLALKLLDKDSKDYLGLKYLSFAYLNLDELDKANDYITKGLKYYGKDFEKLKNMWYGKKAENNYYQNV